MLCITTSARIIRRLFVPSTRRMMTAWIICGGLLASAHAQYPGRIDATKKKAAMLRSIAVLEWTGEPGKPSASRIVPIAVFDGKTYQDGGIYMASPAPLAVAGDTEYQLLQTGTPQGNFDVFSAGEVDGFWYGYGVWKPTHEAAQPKLAQSKIMPQVVADADPNRPHFKKAGDSTDSAAGSGQDNSSPSSKTSSNPAGASEDDDRPTLKRRSSDSTTSPGSGTTQAPAPSDPSDSSKPAATDDPDRPHLRRRSTSSDPATPQEAVTAINAGDPDRPKLHHGKPAELMESDRLTGTPPNLQQMIAVSDAAYREPHSYAFEWANPDDAHKMQAALEQIARDLLNAKPAPGKTSIPAKTTARVAPKATPAHPATAHPATVHPATRTAAKKQPVNTTSPQLVEEDFKAFELAYSGGSTLVFTARTIDDGTPIRYVTLIAQPDFYGVPQVIFKQITDANHLDFTPRLRLVDAVDTDADNRAELIFEQRSKSDRQFAIYSVGSNHVEQIFATGSLP